MSCRKMLSLTKEFGPHNEAKWSIFELVLKGFIQTKKSGYLSRK